MSVQELHAFCPALKQMRLPDDVGAFPWQWDVDTPPGQATPPTISGQAKSGKHNQSGML